MLGAVCPVICAEKRWLCFSGFRFSNVSQYLHSLHTIFHQKSFLTKMYPSHLHRTKAVVFPILLWPFPSLETSDRVRRAHWQFWERLAHVCLIQIICQKWKSWALLAHFLRLMSTGLYRWNRARSTVSWQLSYWCWPLFTNLSLPCHENKDR